MYFVKLESVHGPTGVGSAVVGTPPSNTRMPTEVVWDVSGGMAIGDPARNTFPALVTFGTGSSEPPGVGDAVHDERRRPQPSVPARVTPTVVPNECVT